MPISVAAYLHSLRGGDDRLIDVHVYHVYRPTAEREALADAAMLRARQILEENGFAFGRVDQSRPSKTFVDRYRDCTKAEWNTLVLHDSPRSGSMDVFLVERLRGAAGRASVEGAVAELDLGRPARRVGRTLAHEMGHALGLPHRLDLSVLGYAPFQKSLMAQSGDVSNPDVATRLGSTERSTVRLSPFSHDAD